jgi:hypothetical protein
MHRRCATGELTIKREKKRKNGQGLIGMLFFFSSENGPFQLRPYPLFSETFAGYPIYLRYSLLVTRFKTREEKPKFFKKMHKNTPKIQFSPDFDGSTFMHVIYFDPTNEENVRDMIHGFSKSDRHIESYDKDYVLMRMCKKVYWAPRYLPTGKVLRIEIYKKPDVRFSWGQSHQILTLYPDKFVIESHESISNRVAVFLDTLYKRIGKGHPLDDVKVMSQLQGKAYEKTLNDLFTYRKFKTEKELTTFVANWIGQGHPETPTYEFMRRYAEKYFPAMVPKATELVNGLTGKFTQANDA